MGLKWCVCDMVPRPWVGRGTGGGPGEDSTRLDSTRLDDSTAPAVSGDSTARGHGAKGPAGPKSEAPRAALLAEACAPPGATSGMEGDPPSIDLGALAFRSTNVIARQSLRSGGRSLLSSSSPVARFVLRREAVALRRPPVARLAAPTPRPLARRPRLPDWPPQPLTGSPEGSQLGSGSSSDQHRFPPREPGWPSDSPPPPLLAASVPRHRSSGSGWRCACRYGAHSAPAVSPGQEAFFELTGLTTEKPGYPQKFLVHPPFAHRLCTGNTLTRPRFAG